MEDVSGSILHPRSHEVGDTAMGLSDYSFGLKRRRVGGGDYVGPVPSNEVPALTSLGNPIGEIVPASQHFDTIEVEALDEHYSAIPIRSGGTSNEKPIVYDNYFNRRRFVKRDDL